MCRGLVVELPRSQEFEDYDHLLQFVTTYSLDHSCVTYFFAVFCPQPFSLANYLQIRASLKPARAANPNKLQINLVLTPSQATSGHHRNSYYNQFLISEGSGIVTGTSLLTYTAPWSSLYVASVSRVLIFINTSQYIWAD